jgi:hypothetical protein
MTFNCIAGFSKHSFRGLLLVQLAVACVSVVILFWFLSHAWLPVLDQSISRMPATGQIRYGRLDWTAEAPVRLGESPFLSLIVDPKGSRELGQIADVQLELRERVLRVYSLLGFVDFPYVPQWQVALSQAEARAWYGAWRPFIIMGIAVFTVTLLFFVWFLVATLYALPLWLVAFFTDREITVAGCWKLAAAALLPGALWLGAAVMLYGLRRLSLTGLLVATPFHLLLGWLYLGVALRRLSRAKEATPLSENPFLASPIAETR